MRRVDNTRRRIKIFTAITNSGTKRRFTTYSQAIAWLGNLDKNGKLISYPAPGGHVADANDMIIAAVGVDGGAVKFNGDKNKNVHPSTTLNN